MLLMLFVSPKSCMHEPLPSWLRHQNRVFTSYHSLGRMLKGCHTISPFGQGTGINNLAAGLSINEILVRRNVILA